MGKHINEIRREVVPDPEADTSYLDQPEFADRREQYRREAFSFIGVRAVAEIHLDLENNGGWIAETVTTPGLWSIEDDSEESYIESVYQDECTTLTAILLELGFTEDEIKAKL